MTDRWFVMVVEMTDGQQLALRGTFDADGRLTRRSPRCTLGEVQTPMFVRRVERIIGGGRLDLIAERLAAQGWPVQRGGQIPAAFEIAA